MLRGFLSKLTFFALLEAFDFGGSEMRQPIGLFVQAIGGDEDEAWRQNNNEVLTLMATANTPSMSVDQQCYNQHTLCSFQ